MAQHIAHKYMRITVAGAVFLAQEATLQASTVYRVLSVSLDGLVGEEVRQVLVQVKLKNYPWREAMSGIMALSQRNRYRANIKLSCLSWEIVSTTLVFKDWECMLTIV